MVTVDRQGSASLVSRADAINDSKGPGVQISRRLSGHLSLWGGVCLGNAPKGSVAASKFSKSFHCAPAGMVGEQIAVRNTSSDTDRGTDDGACNSYAAYTALFTG